MTSCLLLAAGLGTRLDPITRLVAKPAVPLGQRTLVEHVIAWLRRQGVHDLVLNLHHRPESIAAIVGDGTHLGVSARYSWEQPVLGSAGGPRRALPLMTTDPFVIVNGDTLCDFDLEPMRLAHEKSGADVTMAVVPNADPGRYNGIRSGSHGEVLSFVPKGQAEGTWHFVGVQIVNKSTFAGLPDGQPAETVAGLYRELAAREPRRMRVWPVDASFLDVGTPADYLRASLALDDRWPVDHGTPGGARVDRVSRTVVWRGASVDPSASLQDCIVAGDCTVPAGFGMTGSVIVPASVLRPGEQVECRDGLACFPLLTRGDIAR